MTTEFSKRTLYLQVHDVLLDKITSGEWKIGAGIPNEVDLSREYGVSVGTMRKALELLEVEKLIIRRQGRGSYVLDRGNENERFCRLRDADGLTPGGTTDWAPCQLAKSSDEESHKLAIPIGAPIVRRICVRRRNGRAYLFEQSTLPHHLFPSIDSTVGVTSEMTALAQANGLILSTATEVISIMDATRDAQVALNLSRPQLAAYFDRLIRTIDGTVVEWRRAWGLLGDLRYEVQLD